MERTRFPGGAVSIGAILLLSAVLVPRDAQAASVRIDYDVIGFTFAGPFSQGDITGGMISIVVPNATSTAFTTTVPATLTKLSLTGPSGSFSLLGSWPLNLIPFTSPSGLSLTFNGSQSGQVTTGGNLLSAVLTSIRLTYFSVFGSGGSGIQGSASGNIGHFLGIGSEVRTVVPEPTSGILLGLGLAGVGVAVGSGPALRRRLTNKS